MNFTCINNYFAHILGHEERGKKKDWIQNVNEKGILLRRIVS